MLNDHFVPIVEARKVAGDISARTLYRWAKDGLFPSPYRIGPNRVGWLQSELEEWLTSKKKADQGTDAPEAA